MAGDSSERTQQVQRRLLSTCGRIRWWDDAGHKGTGTGYLVGPDLVMTCDHVLGSSPSAAGWSVNVTFVDGEYGATVLRRDPMTDCALLRLTRPSGTLPLALGSTAAPDRPFWTAGFPAINDQAPVLLSGSVQAVDWPDAAGVFSTVLFSPMIAAGRGALAQGFSGSPVLVDELCVGHLTSIIPDAGATAYAGRPYAQLGYLYACRSQDVLSMTAGLIAPAMMQPSADKVRRQPTRLSLRQLLLAMTDEIEFDSFISNHYPVIFRRHISSPMPPLKKIDILLVHLSGRYDEVLEGLKSDYGSQFERHANILKYD